jgi:hypothetical protein
MVVNIIDLKIELFNFPGRILSQPVGPSHHSGVKINIVKSKKCHLDQFSKILFFELKKRVDQ